MPKVIFDDVLLYIHESILAKWIFGLSMKKLGPSEVELYFQSDDYDDNLRARNHCFKIGDDFYVFSTSLKQIFGMERAFIDWSVALAYEYFAKGYDFSDIKILIDKAVARRLISLSINSDGYNLSNPWKQLSENISYFGVTAQHYDDQNYEVFQENDLRLSCCFEKILEQLEAFNLSTNEGERIEISCALIKGEKSPLDQDFCEILSEQYVKSLSCKKIIFKIDEYGKLIGIEDISSEAIDETFRIFPMLNKDLPHEADTDFIVSKILNFQMANPDKSIFIISTNNRGDIFIYKNQSIVFFNRSGTWFFLNYHSITDSINMNIGRIDNIDALAITVIDMMIKPKGCCIGVFNLSQCSDIDDIISIGKIDYDISQMVTVCRCFWRNTRNMRKQFLSIDGAVLVSATDGEILNIGSIIPNRGASSQGARTTAAKGIASLGGLSIKVSDDGYCDIYAPQEGTPLDEIKVTFSIGK